MSTDTETTERDLPEGWHWRAPHQGSNQTCLHNPAGSLRGSVDWRDGVNQAWVRFNGWRPIGRYGSEASARRAVELEIASVCFPAALSETSSTEEER